MMTPNRHKDLEGALYVPSLKKDLLSVARMADLGMKIYFDQNECSVHDGCSNKVIVTAPRKGSLYQVTVSEGVDNALATTSCNSESELWHKRMGHINMKMLYQMTKEGLAT